MTEFEAAFDFVKDYAAAAAVAIRRDGRLDDLAEYRRFCERRGLVPTPERLSLARDVAAASREYFAGVTAGGGMSVGVAGVAAEDLADVPPLFLLDSLECRGWRAAFLHRAVRG